MPYCGLKHAPDGPDAAGAVDCKPQWRRFGRDVVAASPLALLQAFMRTVDPKITRFAQYCGAKAEPPSGSNPKAFAPNQARCADTAQLRMWGRLPTKAGVEIRTNVREDGTLADWSTLPPLLRNNYDDNDLDTSTFVYLATNPRTKDANSMAVKNWEKRDRSHGELVVAYAFVSRRTTTEDNVYNGITELPVGWMFGRIAAPGVKDRAESGDTTGATRVDNWRCIAMSLYVIPTYAGQGPIEERLAYRLMGAFESAILRYVRQHETAIQKGPIDLVEFVAKRKTRKGGTNNELTLTIETIDADCMRGARHIYAAHDFHGERISEKKWRIVPATKRAPTPLGLDDQGPPVADPALGDGDPSVRVWHLETERTAFVRSVRHKHALELCTKTLQRSGREHVVKVLSDKSGDWTNLTKAEAGRYALVAGTTPSVGLAIVTQCQPRNAEATSMHDLECVYDKDASGEVADAVYDWEDDDLFKPDPAPGNDRNEPGIVLPKYLRHVAAFWFPDLTTDEDTRRIHELVLFCGRPKTGRALLAKVVELLLSKGASDDDVLYVTAAYDQGVEPPLWRTVYQDRYGFRKVAGLRVVEATTFGVPLLVDLATLQRRLQQTPEAALQASQRDALGRMRLAKLVRPDRSLLDGSFLELRGVEIEAVLNRMAEEHASFGVFIGASAINPTEMQRWSSVKRHGLKVRLLQRQLRSGKSVLALVIHVGKNSDGSEHWVLAIVRHMRTGRFPAATAVIEYYDSLGQSLRSREDVYEALRDHLVPVVGAALLSVTNPGNALTAVPESDWGTCPLAEVDESLGERECQTFVYDPSFAPSESGSESESGLANESVVARLSLVDTRQDERDQYDGTECGVWVLLRALYAATETPYVPPTVSSDAERKAMRRRFFEW